MLSGNQILRFLPMMIISSEPKLIKTILISLILRIGTHPTCNIRTVHHLANIILPASPISRMPPTHPSSPSSCFLDFYSRISHFVFQSVSATGYRRYPLILEGQWRRNEKLCHLHTIQRSDLINLRRSHILFYFICNNLFPRHLTTFGTRFGTRGQLNVFIQVAIKNSKQMVHTSYPQYSGHSH